MSYLQSPAVDETQIPTLAEIQQAFGFVPNFYRAQVARPDLIAAEAGLVGTILLREGALSRMEKEYVFLVCSAANMSTYCVTAHCEIIRMLGIDGPEPEQVAVDHASADIPMNVKALLNFALKLNNQPGKYGERDVETLRIYGYSDQQIMEAVLCVGLAKFANSVAFGLGTAPDFETRSLRLPARAST